MSDTPAQDDKLEKALKEIVKLKAQVAALEQKTQALESFAALFQDKRKVTDMVKVALHEIQRNRA